MNYRKRFTVAATPVLISILIPMLAALTLSLALAAGPAGVLYSQDFEQAKEGEAPPDLTILNGTFAVKAEPAGDAPAPIKPNQVLELAGDPVDGYGALFGPADRNALAVSARIQATSAGRRFPEFGIGCGDTGGYRLILAPAVGELQLLKGEDLKAHVPCDWKSGNWTHFRFQVRTGPDGKWVIEGKAWPQEAAEPAAWTISTTDTEAPPAGHATLWGTPYSGTPIRFDDLLVTEPK